jgi:holo-[acyl-carrier protein] synthase
LAQNARVPLRAGIDLVAVATVEESLRAHGDRYLERVFTERERRDCGGDAARLAARFAAKEAVMKVLRPGEEQLPWREIEVIRNEDGSVDLAVTGRAAELAAVTGIQGFAVSLTHEAGYASAVVVAELDGRRDDRPDP